MNKGWGPKARKIIRDAVAAAHAAQEHAYAPYSHFRVSAAVVDDQWRIHTGCNVENASYGLTCCAERVAIFKMISEGGKSIRFLCVVLEGGDKEGGTPCGACRQVIWEFCNGNKLVPIRTIDISGKTRLPDTCIGILLPDAFVLKK